MARPLSELNAMKLASHLALQRALVACPNMESSLHRWWLETVRATERRPNPQAALMYRRTATLFELLVDRAQW